MTAEFLSAATMSAPSSDASSVRPLALRPARLERALQRCAAAGLRLVITAPADTRTFAAGLAAFPERRVDLTEHVQWETAYRLFCGRSRLPHERGSWRVLAVDGDRRVMGAITARFFTAEAIGEYLFATTLLEPAGPVFREHCELAIGETFAAAQARGRTPGEISHWAVEPDRHAPLAAVALGRALGALAGAFRSPLVVLAADHRRGDVARLMRRGAAPLGRAGKFSLPPFVHQPTGAWLRFLLLDTAVYQARTHSHAATDLATLREQIPVVSQA